jgi:hypothetical protein
LGADRTDGALLMAAAAAQTEAAWFHRPGILNRPGGPA